MPSVNIYYKGNSQSQTNKYPSITKLQTFQFILMKRVQFKLDQELQILF